MSVHQLELFEKRLPKVCQCTDELGVTLYRVQNLAKALRYLNPNQPNSQSIQVFDLDYPEAVLGWIDYNAPPPNIVAINPDNGHAHYFYQLQTPVHYNFKSSFEAQRYNLAVEKALCEQLRADRNYHGPLAKNPMHQHWPVVFFQSQPYSLGDLSAHLDLDRKILDRRRRVEPVGLGRNCYIFDTVRVWAYREFRRPQAWFGFDFWHDAVWRQSEGLNRSLIAPLPIGEINSISKSISKWVWKNFSWEGFKNIQSNRGKKSGIARSIKADEIALKVLEAHKEQPDLKQAELAKIFGIAQQTVSNYLGKYKNENL